MVARQIRRQLTLVGYTLTVVVGVLAAVVGVALIFPPAAMILGGLTLAGFGILGLGLLEARR